MHKGIDIQGNFRTDNNLEISPPTDTTGDQFAEYGVGLTHEKEKGSDIWGGLGKGLENFLKQPWIHQCDVEVDQRWERQA